MTSGSAGLVAAAAVVLGPAVGVLVQRLRRRTAAGILGPATTAPAPSDPSAAGAQVGAQAGAQASTQAGAQAAMVAQKRQKMDDMRADLGTFGTATGVSSGGLIATGTWTKIQDLFPLPGGTAGVFAAVCCLGGLALAIVASALLTTRFFRARRQIVLDSDYERSQRSPSPAQPSVQPSAQNSVVPASDRQLVDGFFAESMAPEEHALVRSRLTAVDPGPDAEPERRADYQDQTRLELLDGALLVLERRSSQVYRRASTLVLACAASLGVALLFIGADYSAGERARVTEWTGCVSSVGKDLAGRCNPLDPLTPSSAAAGATGTAGTPSPSSSPS